MSSGDQPQHQEHREENNHPPHVAVFSPENVTGLGLGDRTIVQLRTTGTTNSETNTTTDTDSCGGTEGFLRVHGTLPEDLIANTPHLDTPERTSRHATDEHIIPLPPAPDWYLQRVENEFSPEDWVVKANQFAANSDAGEMEAVVMALSEKIDTVGAGQAAVISDVTSWPETLVQDILTTLHSSKHDEYQRQTYRDPPTDDHREFSQ